jgi:hypothetical protein
MQQCHRATSSTGYVHSLSMPSHTVLATYSFDNSCCVICCNANQHTLKLASQVYLSLTTTHASPRT